jgi:hypothetical protein
MRGAFVVHLRKITPGNQLAGSVEEVDTGKQARFSSGDELIEFLRERFSQIQKSGQEKEGSNERNDGS